MGKTILSWKLEGKARTRSDILRVVFGPCVQYCPCEAFVLTTILSFRHEKERTRFTTYLLFYARAIKFLRRSLNLDLRTTYAPSLNPDLRRPGGGGGGRGGGGRGVSIKIISKSTLWLFLIEGSDIYQLLLIPWKNIVPSRNYRRSKVSACVLLYCASDFQ